jgi:DNA (cytosine-5)-methyltransferase 1
MIRPRWLELYACQGGSAAGYAAAGFEVVCVDKDPQPRNPFEFHQADALEFLAEHGHEFDVIGGGPPCQRYSKTQRIQGNEHPDLIAATRTAMIATGNLYVIENVEEARSELVDPVLLCGSMFGLHTYRHRLFESNVPLAPLGHAQHEAPNVKMGRPLGPGDFYHAVGNFSNVPYVRADLGVPWMSREGIRECIPPVYAESIGMQMRMWLNPAPPMPQAAQPAEIQESL